MTDLRLLQHRAADGSRSVILAEGDTAHFLPGVTSVRELAQRAIAAGETLADTARACGQGADVDIRAEFDAGRLLAPIDPADAAHLILSGPGLTPLGSAEGPAKMHPEASATEQQTHSKPMLMESLQGTNHATGQGAA